MSEPIYCPICRDRTRTADALDACLRRHETEAPAAFADAPSWEEARRAPSPPVPLRRYTII